MAEQAPTAQATTLVGPLNAGDFRALVANATTALAVSRAELLDMVFHEVGVIDKIAAIFAYQGFDPVYLRSAWMDRATKAGRDSMLDLVVTSCMVLVMGTNFTKQKSGLSRDAQRLADTIMRVYAISDIARPKLGDNVRVTMTLNRFGHCFPDVMSSVITQLGQGVKLTGEKEDFPRALSFPGALSIVPHSDFGDRLKTAYDAWSAGFSTVINKAGKRPGSRQVDKGDTQDWSQLAYDSPLFSTELRWTHMLQLKAMMSPEDSAFLETLGFTDSYNVWRAGSGAPEPPPGDGDDDEPGPGGDAGEDPGDDGGSEDDDDGTGGDQPAGGEPSVTTTVQTASVGPAGQAAAPVLASAALAATPTPGMSRSRGRKGVPSPGTPSLAAQSPSTAAAAMQRIRSSGGSGPASGKAAKQGT